MWLEVIAVLCVMAIVIGSTWSKVIYGLQKWVYEPGDDTDGTELGNREPVVVTDKTPAVGEEFWYDEESEDTMKVHGFNPKKLKRAHRELSARKGMAT
jgi:hypothetical protein